MNSHLCKYTLALVAVLPVAGVHADVLSPLTHNPFSRPSSAVTLETRPLPAADGSVQVLDLRATMVASKDRLANVAGRILRPGDDVHRYTLLEVFEDRAVFSRDGKRLTVYVKPEREENGE